MKCTKKLIFILLALTMVIGMMPAIAHAEGEVRCYADTTWTVTSNGSTFTVRRFGDLSRTETVYYRTVSMSAIEGQHFTKATGSLTFGANEDTKSVTVTERNPSGAYAYQVGATRSYRFEVCDPGGFTLAYADRSISKGTSVSASALRWITVDVSSSSSTYTITDNGYAQGYIPVPIDNYFNQAPKGYLQLVGATELHMFVDLEAAEKDDGYQHIQIYVNDNQNVDTGAGDGTPGTVSYSAYAACFGHKPGSKDETYARYQFPVASINDQGSAETPWTGISNTVGKLYKQLFNANRRSSSNGYLRLCGNNISGVQTLGDLSTVGIRLNASGDNNDSWYAKNIKATIKAFETRDPVADTDNIVVAPAPGSDGKYREGNLVYVSVPFSEIVDSQGWPYLVTTWGNFECVEGLKTNVLTFRGTVPSGKTSTILKVTGISENSLDIKDLAGNTLNKSFRWDGAGHTTAEDYAYAVTYDLGGGSDPGNPSSYTYSSNSFTLKTPVLCGRNFAGWTGTGLTAQTDSVTVAKGSHGDRHYVAQWAGNLWGLDDGADGSADHPYVISTPDGLLCLRDAVSSGIDFSEQYFKLGADIDMRSVENFDTIGYLGKPFKGSFDGCGYTISYLNATCGLFGRIVDGAVSSLTLDHVTAAGQTSSNVGGLAGTASNTAISNCVVQNSTVSGSGYVGGLVGYVDNTDTVNGKKISSCVVRDTSVSGSGNHVGGFVGYLQRTALFDCIVADSVVSGSDYVGGFCGRQYSGSTDYFVLRTNVTGTTGANNCGLAYGSSQGTYTPYYYNCTGVEPNQYVARFAVYTVTAGEDITVSGTAAKTYENINYYKKDETITLDYTGEVPAGSELSYSVNGTQIVGSTFSITGDSEAAAIRRKLLTHSDITITVPAQISTGSVLAPEITVKDGDTTLTAGTDYTVGDWSGELAGAGIYTATLTGIGSYAGTATATFKIKAPGSDIVRVGTVDYDDLDEAKAAWTDGTTLTLLADVTIPADTTLTVSAQDVTLDLGGHKLTGGNGMPAVTIDGGSLTLRDSCGGGTITHKEGENGCGVHVFAGSGITSSFTMESGTISGNTGTGNYSGGVYVHSNGSASFTMNGGSITGNIFNGNSGSGGGGVRCYNGTFTMNGGSITGNSTKTGNGGGVFFDSGSFTMNGGTITGNTAFGAGGGIYTNKNIKVSGDVTILGNRSGTAEDGTGGKADNVYINNESGRRMIISVSNGCPLTADARIGVTCSDGAGVFTADLTGRATADNFVSDNDDYTVVINSDGKGELYRDYAVSIAETANGAVTASVGGQTVTRAAEGQTVALTVSPDAGFALESLTVTGAGGSEVTVTNNSFTMPDEAVTVNASFTMTWASIATAMIRGNDVTLIKDVTAAATDGRLMVPQGSSTVLDLNGHTLSRGLTEAVDNGCVIEVRGSLTVTDSSTSKAGTITGGNNSGSGGGVYLYQGKFTFSGGTISGNSADKGGGVFVRGAGSSCIVTLSGGTISDNNASTDGGGMFVQGASNISFEAGAISDNNASAAGGGVYAIGGQISMSGGVISGNTAAGDGGGVFIRNCTIKMSGGVISGNTAADGGGVYIGYNKLVMSGGAIENNTATGGGGGVYVNGPFEVSGSPVVRGNTVTGAANNVYVGTGKVITVSGSLTAGASLGVTLSDNTGLFTGGLSGNGDASAFTSDNSAFAVYLSGGEAALGTLHAVTVADGITGGTVTASPASAVEGQTVTLTVTPDAGFAPGTLTYTPAGGEAQTITADAQTGAYAFTMPAANVTVTATFLSAAPVFNGQSLLLSGEIGVRFRMSFPAGANMAGSYMDFRVSDGRTSRVAFEDSGTAADSSDRVFICYINALELNDTITATFHYGEKTVVKEYSAMEYMEYIRDNYTGEDRTKLVSLLDALQNYGHYLSKTDWTDYRQHEPIAPSSTRLDADSIATAAEAVSEKGIVKNVGDTGIDPANVYFSLTLNAETVINLFIEKTEGLTIASAKDGETGLSVTETQMSGKTYYRIRTAPIGAGALENDRVITVTTGGAKTATFTVSAMSYVKALLAGDVYAQKFAVTAIYQYAEASRIYALATGQN